MRLLLLDNRVHEYNTVAEAVTEGIDVVVFDYKTDTFETLISKIKYNNYESVGIFQENNSKTDYKLLDSLNYSILINISRDDPELTSWTEYIDILNYFKTKYNIQTIDLMGCNIGSNKDWKYITNKISNDLDIIINSSIDETGSDFYGGNWILEVGNVNLIGTYFTDKINNFKSTLGSTYDYTSFVQNLSGDIGAVFIAGGYNTSPFPIASSNSPNKGTYPIPSNVQFFVMDEATVVYVQGGVGYGYGLNNYRQFGVGTASSYSSSNPRLLTITANVGYNYINLYVGYNMFAGVLSSKYVWISKPGSNYVFANNIYGEFNNAIFFTRGPVNKYILTDDGLLWMSNASNTNPTAPYYLETLPNVSNGAKIVYVATGENHVMVLLSDGTVWGKGDNTYGQLGINSTVTFVNEFTQVLSTDGSFGYYPFTKVSCGLHHTVVLDSNGDAWGAGRSNYGQLGYYDPNSTQPWRTSFNYLGLPVGEPTTTKVLDISTGANHSIIRLSSGKVATMGRNHVEQLGNVTKLSTNFPYIAEWTYVTEGYNSRIGTGGSTAIATGIVRLGDEFNYSTYIPSNLPWPTMSITPPTIYKGQTLNFPLPTTNSSNTGAKFFCSNYSILTNYSFDGARTFTALNKGSYEMYVYIPKTSTYRAQSIFTTGVVIESTVITCTLPTTSRYLDVPFNANATSTSSEPFIYSSSNTSVATIDSNGLITIVNPGTTTITISQNAGTYDTAATKTISFTVGKAIPTVNTPFTVTNKTYGDSSFTLTNPSTTSSGTWSYTVTNSSGVITNDTSVISISGNTVTINGGGSVYITATQASTTLYDTYSVTIPFTVNKADYILGSFSLPAKSVSDDPFNLTPYNSTSVSNGAWSYFIVNNGQLVSSNEFANVYLDIVTLTAGGTVIIRAVQAATNNYISKYVEATLVINKVTPTIDQIVVPSNLTYNGTNTQQFEITIPNTNSSNTNYTVTSSNTSVITITISDLANKIVYGNILGYGQSTITVSYEENYYYNSISTSLQVSIGIVPTIGSFTLPTNKAYNETFTITDPTSNSLGSWTYTVPSNNGIISISNNIATVIGVGTTTITATQGANGIYNSITTSATITTVKATPTYLNFTLPTNNTYGDSTFTITEPTTNVIGGLTYSSSNSSVATIVGNTVTIVGSGTSIFTVSPTNTNNYNLVTTTATLTVNKAIPTYGTFSLPTGKVYGDSSFTITAPTTNVIGGLTYTSSDTSVASISGTTLTITGAGTVTITVSPTVSNNYTNVTTSATLTINKAIPTYGTFSLPTSKVYGDSSFTITAPTTNVIGGLTYTSSDTSVASISGTTLTITGVGTATITVSPTVSNNYTNVTTSATITIAKGTPTYGTFTLPTGKVYGDSSFTITEPTTNVIGGLTYTSSNILVATIIGTTVTIIGAGTTTITASPTNLTNYNNVTKVASLTISKANPTYETFTLPNNLAVGDIYTITNLNITTNIIGGVTYTSSNTSVATISGTTLTITGVGTTTITARPTNLTNYNNVTTTTTITSIKGTPTYSNFIISNKTYGDSSFTIIAPTTNVLGGLTYTSSDTSVATISGTTVTITGVGTTIISVSPLDLINYDNITGTTTLTVNKAIPTYGTFSLPTGKVYGDSSFTITAPTTNVIGGLTYTSSNTSVVTIIETTIIIIGVGTATITVSPTVSNNYTTVNTSAIITVVKGTPTYGTFTLPTNKVYGDSSFTITAPITNVIGGLTYTSSNTSVATISGTTITITGAGTTTITASPTNLTNYNLVSTNTTFTINKGTPTYGTFTLPTNKKYGDEPFTFIEPTTNVIGGLSYTSSDTSIATVVNNTITILKNGGVEIIASPIDTINYNIVTTKALLLLNLIIPTISSYTIPTKIYSPSQTFTLNNPISNSDGIWSYKVLDNNQLEVTNNGIISILNNNVTILTPGTVTIVATQAATDIYYSTSINAQLIINKANPTIGSFSIPNQAYGIAPFSISTYIPTSTSNGSWSFTSSITGVASISGNTISINGFGTTVITATQAATLYYNSISITTNLSVSYSTNIQWNSVYTGTTNIIGGTEPNIVSITSSPSYLVAVCDNGYIINSNNGLVWNSNNYDENYNPVPFDTNTWSSITYGNNLFVAVARSGTSNRAIFMPSDLSSINYCGQNSEIVPSALNTNSWTSVTYGNGLFVAVANSGTGNRVMTSPDGNTWTIRASAADNNWTSVTFGNNLFVAVASGSTTVMYSSNGTTWSTTGVTGVVANSWTSVAYGNGYFVAVSSNGTNRSMYSTDGKAWTAVATNPSGVNWTSISFGYDNNNNGIFMAISNNSATLIDTSITTNGTSWTAGSMSATNNDWQSICYSSNLSSTIGGKGFVAVSNTGTGNRAMIGNYVNPVPFIYNMTLYDLTDFYGKIMYASFKSSISDGLFYQVDKTTPSTYSQYSSKGWINNNHQWLETDSVYYGNSFSILETIIPAKGYIMFEWGVSCASDNDNFMCIITDNSVTPNYTSTSAGNALYYTNISRIVYRTPVYIDLTQFKNYTNLRVNFIFFKDSNSNISTSKNDKAYLYSFVYIENYLLPQAGLLTLPTDLSYNGISSTYDIINPTSQSTQQWFYTSSNPNVATVSGNTITINGFGSTTIIGYQKPMNAPNDSGPTYGCIYRTETLTVDDNLLLYWTPVYSPNLAFTSIVNNNANTCVATTNGGTIYYSTNNGSTWTASSAATRNWTDVAYGNNLFIAISNSTNIVTSSDGITWTARTSVINGWSSITFGNGTFVAVANSGTNTRVMYSSNGTTWLQPATAPPANNWTSITFGNNTFVAVANSGTNRVMYSTDGGVSWLQPAIAPTANSWSSITFGNNTFVAVANLGTNRIMTSTDGITWSTDNITSLNNNWTSITYGTINSINMFVACSSDTFYDNIYVSLDGINWYNNFSPFSKPISSIGFGNNNFIALSNDTTTSSDSNIFIGSRTNTSLNLHNTLKTNILLGTTNSSKYNVDFTSGYNSTLTNNTNMNTSNYYYTPGNGIPGNNQYKLYSSRYSSSVILFTNNNVNNSVSISETTVTPTLTGSIVFDWSTVSEIGDTFLFAITNNSVLPTFTSTSPGNSLVYFKISGTVTSKILKIPLYQFLNFTSLRINFVYFKDRITSTTDTPYLNSFLYYSKTNPTIGPLIIPKIKAYNDIPYTITNPTTNSTGSFTYTSSNTLNGSYNPVTISGNIITPNGITGNKSIPLTLTATLAEDTNYYSGSVTSQYIITEFGLPLIWKSRFTSINNNWTSICYGNGLYVAVGSSGTGNRVMTSTNGINWTIGTSAADNNWSSVTYGVVTSTNTGLFVAVANSGTNRIMTSPDGITWTSRTYNIGYGVSNYNFTSVCYGNGLFVAVSSNGWILLSSDGITWDLAGSRNNNYWNTQGENYTSICYGNGLFVAVASSGTGNRVITSSNAYGWTNRTSASDNNWTCITYGLVSGSGLFVAVANSGTGNRVMTSPDGITWTIRTSAADNNWTSITYGTNINNIQNNNLFVAIGTTTTPYNHIMTSIDGITWNINSKSAANNNWTSITYANNFFIAVSSNGLNNCVMTGNYNIPSEINQIYNDNYPVIMSNIEYIYNIPKELLISSSYSNNFNCDINTSIRDLNKFYLFNDTTTEGLKQYTSYRFEYITGANIIRTTNTSYDLSVSVLETTINNSGFLYIDWEISSSILDYFICSISRADIQQAFTINNGVNSLYYKKISSINKIKDVVTLPNSPQGYKVTFMYCKNETISTNNDTGIVNKLLFSTNPPPTVSDLAIPSILYNDITTYTIVDPTSNSSGLWEYYSSDPSICSINNNIITIKGTGDVTITAIQYQDSNYSTYETTKNITICYNTPITWKNIYAPGSSTNVAWRSLAYGNNIYVAVGNNGLGMYSNNLSDWKIIQDLNNNNWSSITFGNGIFVAVSTSGTNRVMYSSDAITWSHPIITPIANNWTSVTYGNGIFVAVANSGTGNRVMTSTNGVDWTSRTSAADNNWSSITFGNGIFVAVANSGTGNRVMTSPDGITWTSRTSVDNNWSSITYGNNTFVAVASGSTTVMYSSNGIEWSITGVTGVVANNWTSISYGLVTSTTPNTSLFVAVANSGTGTRVMTSSDGIAWTSRTSVDNNWSSITYGNNTFVAVSSSGIDNQIMTISNTLQVNYIFSPGTTSITSICYANNYNGLGDKIYVAVSNSGSTKRIIKSIDGINWTIVDAPIANNWTSVTYGNNTFVAVANSGTNRVMYSTDGTIWSQPITAPTANNWTSITFGNGIFVAVANSGTNRVMYSLDGGLSWTQPTIAPLAIDWRSITYGNGTFVAVSNGGIANCTTMSSTNGENWSSKLYPSNNSWRSIAYGNGLFVAISSDGTNRIMISTDLNNWTQINVIPNEWVSITYGVINDIGYFVAVAAIGSNRVMYSIDGITWLQPITPPATIGWRSVTYGNGTFVAVASDGTNRVMYSTDGGVSWSQPATPPTANNWTSITFGNNTFVAVANSGTNRVMYSTDDGVSWLQPATPPSSISWRSITFGNNTFVAVANSGTNRVMYSTDGGVSWLQPATPPTANNWTSITYENNTFVAVANSGTNRVMYSTDGGVSWSQPATPPTANSWEGITYGIGMFVAISTDGANRVMYSTDGINWGLIMYPINNNWSSITYGNGYFIAVAVNGTNRVMYSTDGTYWNIISNFDFNWSAITYNGGYFFAVTNSGSNVMLTNSNIGDLVNKIVNIGNNCFFTSICAGGGVILATTNTLLGTNLIYGTYDLNTKYIYNSQKNTVINSTINNNFNSTITTNILDLSNKYADNLNVQKYVLYPFVYTNNSFINTNKFVNNSISLLETIIPANGSILFDWSVSSETTNDNFIFVITDNLNIPTYTNISGGSNSLIYESISGSTTQTNKKYNLYQYGIENVKINFVYYKNNTTTSNNDTATLSKFIVSNKKIPILYNVFTITNEICIGDIINTISPPGTDSDGIWNFTSSNTSIASISNYNQLLPSTTGSGGNITITGNSSETDTFLVSNTVSTTLTIYRKRATNLTDNSLKTKLINYYDLNTNFNNDIYTHNTDTNLFYFNGNNSVTKHAFIYNTLTNNFTSGNTNIANSVSIMEIITKPIGSLTFDWSVDSEQNYDYFIFAVTNISDIPTFNATTAGNSLYYKSISGNISRTTLTYNLSNFGYLSNLRINFVYYKNSSTNTGTDTATLHNLIITGQQALLGDFILPTNKKYGDSPFTLTPPLSNSTGTWSYIVSDENGYSLTNNSIISITNNVVTINGGGSAYIRATQEDTTGYLSNFKIGQLIIQKNIPIQGEINIPSDYVYSDGAYTFTTHISNPNSYPTSNSTGSWGYSLPPNNGVATIRIINGFWAISFTGIGSVTLTATQEETLYFQSKSVTKTLNIKSLPFIDSLILPVDLVLNSTYTLQNPQSESDGSWSYTSSNTNIATISGNVLTVVGKGSTIIRATQSGTSLYLTNYVENVLYTERITNLGSLILPNTLVLGDSDYTITNPTSNNTGGIFSYTSSNISVAEIIYDNINLVYKIKINGIGSATITSTQSVYNNFTSASTSIIINVKETPVILSLTLPNNKKLNDQFIITNPESNSSGDWTYTSSNSSIILLTSAINPINGKTITTAEVKGIGTATIIGTQQSTTNYISGIITASITIKNTSTLNNFTLQNKYINSPSFTIQNPSSNNVDGLWIYEITDINGNPTNNTSVVSITGNNITINGAGSVYIKATQSETTSYYSNYIITPLTILKSTPTLNNFNLPSNKKYLETFNLTPPNSISNGTWTYQVTDSDGNQISSNIISIENDIVTINGVGTVYITATQSETTTYLSQSITSMLTTIKATPNLLNFNLPTDKRYLDTIVLTPPSSTNSSTNWTYRITDANGTPISSSVATISGNNLISNKSGTVYVTATQSESVNYNSASITSAITIGKAITIINNFNLPTNKKYLDSSFTITEPTSNNIDGTWTYFVSDVDGNPL